MWPDWANFWKFLVTNFLTKVAQIDWSLSRLFWKHQFSSKNCRGTLIGQLWDILIQDTVTLIIGDSPVTGIKFFGPKKTIEQISRKLQNEKTTKNLNPRTTHDAAKIGGIIISEKKLIDNIRPAGAVTSVSEPLTSPASSVAVSIPATPPIKEHSLLVGASHYTASHYTAGLLFDRIATAQLYEPLHGWAVALKTRASSSRILSFSW